VLEFAGDALVTFFADADFAGAAADAAADAGENSVRAGNKSNSNSRSTTERARVACAQMMSSMKAFKHIKLHGGIARGNLRTLHLGCDSGTMAGEHRRGTLFVGSALQRAVELLEESEKGTILVDGGEPVSERTLPEHMKHMGNLKWFKPRGRGNSEAASEDGGSKAPTPPSDTDSAFATDGMTPGAGKPHNMLAHAMRTPTLMYRAAHAKAVEEDRNAQVTNTWALVAENLEGNGVAFFRNVFRIAPEALQLFSFRDVVNLYESPQLKAHATKVMSTVGVAVAGLQDIGKLVPVLSMLGKKHLAYGVLPAHYDVVGQALLETLEAGLGEHWTPAAAHAWATVYGTVADVMKSAAEEAQKAAERTEVKVRRLGRDIREAMATTGVHYLQRYVLRHVVVNESKDSMRMSELRTIASLFARVPVPVDDDVDLDAHNNAFKTCHECVEALGGVVNQYLWDDKGVVLKAAWGLLCPTRDDKMNAAVCAMRLVERLGPQAQVGVASGWAFTGLVGAEGTRLGMVMFGAESVTLAARLMMKAKPGSALTSENVKAATERSIAYEGEDEPDLVLKGRDRVEKVCRPVKLLAREEGRMSLEKSPSSRAMPGIAAADVGLLPRPTMQAPLRDAVHSFIEEGDAAVAASVLVLQGGSGCGKSVLAEQLALTVTYEGETFQLPADRAPEVCVMTAALSHETTPYFIWRCFLHWLFAEERESHHLSPTAMGAMRKQSSGGGLDVNNRSSGMPRAGASTRAMNRTASSRGARQGISLATMDSGNSARRLAPSQTPSSLKQRSLLMLSKNSTFGSGRKMSPPDDKNTNGGGDDAGLKKQGSIKRTLTTSEPEAEEALVPEAGFQIHRIIMDRMASSDESGRVGFKKESAKGASSAEIAAAELLFPSGDAHMEMLASMMTEKDWDDAHRLIKTILVHVVARSKRPLLFVIDDAHFCDPTSWHLVEWLSSPAAAAVKGKLMVVLTGLSHPEAPKFHTARARRLKPTGEGVVHVDELTDDEVKALTAKSLGLHPGESVAPELEAYIVDHANGSPRIVVMLVDLLCREDLVAVSASGVHSLAKGKTWATASDSHDGGSSTHLKGNTGEVSYASLPDSVRSALVARIDMLTAVEADLLKCASCVGVEFPVDVLVQIMEHSLPVLLGLLESIEAQGLIMLIEPGVYKFVYPLQAEVAASLLLTTHREEINAMLASVYEMDATDANPMHVERAEHYEKAGIGYEIAAAECHAAAADDAEATGAWAAALSHVRNVVDVARAQPECANELPVFLARLASLGALAAADEEDVGHASSASDAAASRKEAADSAREALRLIVDVETRRGSRATLLEQVVFGPGTSAQRLADAKARAREALAALEQLR